MKKSRLLFISLLSLLLVSCNSEVNKQKKVIKYINNYSINDNNGFDYNITQTYNNSIMNQESYTVHLYKDEQKNIQGYKHVYIKTLNEGINKDMYNEEEHVYQYKNNQQIEIIGDQALISGCTLENFVEYGLSNYSIDLNKLDDINLVETDTTNTLTFTISSDNAKEVLKISNNTLDNVKGEIKVDNINKRLSEFKLSYTQQYTSTLITFIPYYQNIPVL